MPCKCAWCSCNRCFMFDSSVALSFSGTSGNVPWGTLRGARPTADHQVLPAPVVPSQQSHRTEELWAPAALHLPGPCYDRKQCIHLNVKHSLIWRNIFMEKISHSFCLWFFGTCAVWWASGGGLCSTFCNKPYAYWINMFYCFFRAFPIFLWT